MTQTQAAYVTDKDREAVKRLRDYYRRNFADGASDDGFMRWVSEVLAVIRAEDMKRVKQILETGKDGGE